MRAAPSGMPALRHSRRYLAGIQFFAFRFNRTQAAEKEDNMLSESFIKYRPRNVCAVYVEPRVVEVVRASRRWRTWEMEPVERYQVPEEEGLLEYLAHIGLRPKAKGSALLLFLSGTFYSVHREHYPLSLKDQIEEAVNFDWQENIFHEQESTLHFFGPPTQVEQHISVPIFDMRRELYDKFHQALNAQQFQSFSVMPSALAYDAFLPATPAQDEPGEPMQFLGRILDDSQLEVHRFYRGAFLDSMLIGKSQDTLGLLRENLKCVGVTDGNDNGTEGPGLNLLCTHAECGGRGGYGAEWSEKGLPVRQQGIEGEFVSSLVNKLIEKENIYAFDNELLLKPWQVPHAVWPIIGLVLLFVIFAGYEVNLSSRLTRESKALKTQVTRLENQWKPVEEFQARIGKFQEDKKTLSEFNNEGYPLLELLTYLTILTPEDTYLNYISLRKGQVTMRGESKSAIKYLSELSKTDGLTDVKFASPVTRNPSSDMERFNVQMQLDMSKLAKSLESLPAEKPGPSLKPVAEGSDATARPPGSGSSVQGKTDTDFGERNIVPEGTGSAGEEAIK